VSEAAHYFTPEQLDPSAVTDLEVVIAGRPVTLATAPGVFSARRIDLGTAVLLRTMARQTEPGALPALGRLVDLGCGWGPLALTMASLAPKAQVWAVDINPAARALTTINARRLGLDNIEVVGPEAIEQIGQIDRLWSNPPIRVGKPELHALLTTWLARLGRPDGQAVLVVQRNLGADSLQTWLTGAGFPTDRLASAKGYRVLTARPA